MSNTFTAQELAVFFQKVADGGEIEFRVNSTAKGWYRSGFSPNLSSVRQDWRIKPTEQVIDLKLVDARASYEAARAIDLAKYAAALDAALIDSLFTTYKETITELQITWLINDTWQVEDDDMVWYQGSLEDCQAYLKEQDNV